MSFLNRFFFGSNENRLDPNPLKYARVNDDFDGVHITPGAMQELGQKALLDEVLREPPMVIRNEPIAPHDRGMFAAELRPLLMKTWNAVRQDERRHMTAAHIAAAQGVIEMFPRLADAEKLSTPERPLFLSLSDLLGDSDLALHTQVDIKIAFEAANREQQ
jgi:hypothetical protein